jgi:hypothetical protein
MVIYFAYSRSHSVLQRTGHSSHGEPHRARGAELHRLARPRPHGAKCESSAKGRERGSLSHFRTSALPHFRTSHPRKWPARPRGDWRARRFSPIFTGRVVRRGTFPRRTSRDPFQCRAPAHRDAPGFRISVTVHDTDRLRWHPVLGLLPCCTPSGARAGSPGRTPATRPCARSPATSPTARWPSSRPSTGCSPSSRRSPAWGCSTWASPTRTRAR